MSAPKQICFRILPDGQPMTVKGRDAWALQALHNAGRAGCTPISQPAPRWSSYIFNLRRLGLDIETIHEAHKGPFPGTHGRYVLHSRISILEGAS